MQTKMRQFYTKKKKHMKSLADQENVGTAPMYFTAFVGQYEKKSETCG